MKKLVLTTSLISLLLAGCGGGGGSSTPAPAPIPVDPQVAPVAEAGPDQTITTADTEVELDGSSSSDANGDSLTYSWSFTSVPEGSEASLSEPTGSSPEFIPDVNGDYTVELIVNDGVEDSQPDSVLITLDVNSVPTPNAGPDQNVETGSLVTLDGSQSTDLDGDALTYSWTLSSPTGSGAALDDANAVSPTFTADIDGIYSVQLTVEDGGDENIEDSFDEVVVTASTSNSAPVSAAGSSQNVETGSVVTLDGSASSDANGDLLTFNWSLVSVPENSAASLTDPTTSSPTFTADLDGEYEISLIVTDGIDDSAASSVTVTAETLNSAPTAAAGVDQNVATGSTVSLSGLGSADVNGDALTYAWSLTAVPTGSLSTLSVLTGATTTFTADIDGTYVAQLVVSDATSSSAADTVTVTAQTLNSIPFALAGMSQNVSVGDTVTLDGSGSSDADGDPLSFSWSFSSLPPGSLVTLDDPTSINPSFVADVQGSYVATLVVNDGAANSAASTVSIEAASPSVSLLGCFGGSFNEKPWPYFSSGVVVASVSGSSTYTLDGFKLKAEGGVLQK